MTSSRSDDWYIPSLIYLYRDPSTSSLDAEALASSLEDESGIAVEIREEFISHHVRGSLESLAQSMAEIKVRNISSTHQESRPLYGEIQFELKLLSHPEKRLPGILYDGFKLQSLYRRLLPRSELSMDTVHIALTSRLFGTFDDADKRYHARTIVCGYPSIISTSGIVEAPAKPKKFYIAKRAYGLLGVKPPIEVLKEEHRGEFIDYDDERLTEVMKGYVLQALFYHVLQEPFCGNVRCRLFNAHWQREVIEAQLSSGKLCEHHSKTLREIRSLTRGHSDDRGF